MKTRWGTVALFAILGCSDSDVGQEGTNQGETESTCPEAPFCNWCNGKTIVDDDGCFVAYQCNNGADPCTAQPCFGPDGCGPNEKCVDRLCWPPECSEPECEGAVGPDGVVSYCGCSWTCLDAEYSSSCKLELGVTPSVSCECKRYGTTFDSCGASFSSVQTPDACAIPCCGP